MEGGKSDRLSVREKSGRGVRAGVRNEILGRPSDYSQRKGANVTTGKYWWGVAREDQRSV